jgi:hypothetical protein
MTAMNRRWLIGAAILLLASIALWRRPPRTTTTATTTAAPAQAPAARESARKKPLPPPIRLQPGSADDDAGSATFEGRVVDSQTGAGITGAQISFFHQGAAFVATSSEGGRFRLLLVESGDYTLESITATGYRSYHAMSESEVVLRSRPRVRIHDLLLSLDPQAQAAAPDDHSGDGDSDRVDLGAAYAGRLRGIVRTATAFSIVMWQSKGAMERTPSLTRAFFDAEGRFEIDGLAPGEYRVMAAARDSAPSTETRVTIPESGVAEVELRLRAGGRLFGQVIDGASRRPIGGARVELEGLIGDGDSPVPLLAAGLTADDGSFNLRGLGRGPFSIVAQAADHHGRLLSGLDVSEGGELGPLTIDLTPTEPGEKPHMELVGVGAVLQGQGDALVIVRVIPEGGAAEAGLAAGDQILAIDGVGVTDIGFQQAVERIRGPEGSSVILKVRRSGEVQDVTVRRRRLRS